MYRDGLNPLKLPNYQEQCLIIKAISEIPTFLMFHEIKFINNNFLQCGKKAVRHALMTFLFS